MQVFFIENTKSFEETVNECHESLSKKTSSLVKEIVEGGAKGKEELLVLQKKIIVDVILQTALGSPSNQEVRRDKFIPLATLNLSSLLLPERLSPKSQAR